MSVLHVEYRLCPEYPLPAAVEDAVVVYRALLRQNISPSQMMFMGDSAAGGLVLLAIQSLIAHQLPVPRGVIAVSPLTDISASSASRQRNRHTDIILNWDNHDWMVAQLLGPNYIELSANSSVFSLLFGSFHGFPPIYLNVVTAEILEDEVRAVFIKAQEAGVGVTFEEGLHLMHVYPIFSSFFREVRNTMNNIKEWIEKLIA